MSHLDAVVSAAAPDVGAPTIALPLWQALRVRPFSGQVVGRFGRAAQLIDSDGRVIALTMPSLGKGPFSLGLPTHSGVLARLRPGQPVSIDADALVVDHARLPLDNAEIWDPTLPSLTDPLDLAPALVSILRPWTVWPPPAAGSAVQRATASQLAGGARALLAALRQGNRIEAAVEQLAGLGPGLTPAGDDYLLGAMAALWQVGVPAPLSALAAVSVPRTSLLSGAFLQAAARGHFMEDWHHLAHALDLRDHLGTSEAVQRIAAFGASSGQAALAGFAGVLLGSAGVDAETPVTGR